MKTKKTVFLGFFLALFAIGCVSESDLGPGNPSSDDDPLAALDVADEFDYSTSKNLLVHYLKRPRLITPTLLRVRVECFKPFYSDLQAWTLQMKV